MWYLDTLFDISDAISILGYLFLGDPEVLSCEKAADTDGTGWLDITDIVYLLRYLYSEGRPPPPPFPSCGLDSTRLQLSCETYSACES